MKLLLALVLLLAACGGGVEGATTTTVTTTTVTGPTTTLTTVPVETTSTAMESTTTAATATVQVFYGIGDSTGICSEVAPHDRSISVDADRITAALHALVEGPTEEERAAGAFSFFTAETADVVKTATLAGDELTVDFANFSRIIPNASASCGSANLLAELTSTVFQFSDVDSVAYTFDGSCDAFGEFLQMGCITIVRSDWTTITTASDSSATTWYETGDLPLSPPASLPGSGGAGGSGCAPGTDNLSDGIWFGMIEDLSDDAIEFDLACFFWGDAANEAAAQDGVAEIPVPNDYYIRNGADTLRTVEVDADATIHWFPASDNIELEEAAWADWASDPAGYLPCPGDWCLAWIYVNDGTVTEAVQQYTP